jgi:F420-non-reducing hydrogenase small subunit
MEQSKLNMAIYWGAACGGCCVSVLDVHESLFTVTEHANIVFWPIALDTKYSDIENMTDGFIDLTLFNGAVRNSENEHMAKLLRQKSKILVAYGSCAHLGGIPGLANLYSKDDLFKRVYFETESTVNENKYFPETETKVKEGELELPGFYNEVYPLNHVVDVDYFIPGCPPQTERLIEVFLAIVNKDELPPNGSVIGAHDKTQCDECIRKRSEDKSIKAFKRPFELEDDGETCFLEQGLVCMGPATRCGCGYRCIAGNSPCRGCYGPPDKLFDPGAKMMSSIATLIDSNDPNEIERIIEGLEDPAGTFYRYSIPSAILHKKIKHKEESSI